MELKTQTAAERWQCSTYKTILSSFVFVIRYTKMHSTRANALLLISQRRTVSANKMKIEIIVPPMVKMVLWSKDFKSRSSPSFVYCLRIQVKISIAVKNTTLYLMEPLKHFFAKRTDFWKYLIVIGNQIFEKMSLFLLKSWISLEQEWNRTWKLFYPNTTWRWITSQ